MLKSESIFIGIILSIIITECFNYYIFDSKVLSSLAYILVFVVAYEKLTYREKKHVIEKYTNNDIKKKSKLINKKLLINPVLIFSRR